jgi:hypothetical protein
MNSPLSTSIANRAIADKLRPASEGERRTVIPTPRNNGLFPGWGVKV